jgi:hypothetical protein
LPHGFVFNGFTSVWDQPAAPGQWIPEMRAPSISVTLPRPGGRLVFDVIVRDALGESPNQITMHANEAERWPKLGAEPAR